MFYYLKLIVILYGYWKININFKLLKLKKKNSRFFAYKQLERAGAVLTTSECVILGLLQDSAHPKFREIQKIIIESAPDTGLNNYF